LRTLAGNNAKIHITGGEPFLYWHRIEDILKAARQENLGHVDLIETNGFWGTEKKVMISWLKMLKEYGINRLKISCDPFHQEYVDIEPVRYLVSTAREILGSNRVLVRWEKYFLNPVKMNDIDRDERDKIYLSVADQYPFRFTGRAAGRLAELMASEPMEAYAASNCKSNFLGAKGVHIDPFGNVFSGTCSGIILGNVIQTKLHDIWQQFHPSENKLIQSLFYRGPLGLLENNPKLHYSKAKLYAGKCHLCTYIRWLLFDQNIAKDTIGPPECYHK
jgi:MoaA/NifB/PqqE/SkfB family radical SAM enzyme